MKSTVYTALIAACALTLAACEKKADQTADSSSDMMNVQPAPPSDAGSAPSTDTGSAPAADASSAPSADTASSSDAAPADDASSTTSN